MNFNELTYEQRNFLAGGYMCRLADEGTFAEVFGADYDEPSWYDMANAAEIVPEDVLEREYGDYCFTEEDFPF